MGQERAETLAGGAIALDVNGVVGQAVVAVFGGHHAGQHGADGTVAVAYRRDERDLFALFDGWPGAFDEQVVKRFVEAVSCDSVWYRGCVDAT